MDRLPHRKAHDSGEFGFVWFGLVWFGLVWFGLVWFGLVWFGLVWFVGFVRMFLSWFSLKLRATHLFHHTGLVYIASVMRCSRVEDEM
jgi:hypothetical protein